MVIFWAPTTSESGKNDQNPIEIYTKPGFLHIKSEFSFFEVMVFLQNSVTLLRHISNWKICPIFGGEIIPIQMKVQKTLWTFPVG